MILPTSMLFVVLVFLLGHDSVQAQVTNEEASAQVQRMLMQGASGRRILDYLTGQGFALSDAAALAIESSISEQSEVALVRAALCEPDASAGLGALLVAASSNADAVQFAVDTFDPRACGDVRYTPPAYNSTDTPGRGGVSPAN